jgi:endoglucanase
MMGVVTADDRFAYHPSTAATYDMAAAAAQFARLIKPYDRRYAGRCLEAAERAWKAAEENPVFLYGNIPGSGGGNYDDASVSDERFFAAAELFVTTGKGRYRRAAAEYLESPEWDALAGNLGASLSWQQVSFAGALSLASSRRPGFGLRKAAVEGILESAGAYLDVVMSDGYGVPLTEYPWGSNSTALNKGLVMVTAADLAEDAVVAAIFRDAAAGILDYLLGRNALAQSYVTGYGVHDAFSPHHRFWAGDPGLGYPYPPPGVLVGGPNSSPSDGPGRTVADRAAAKRYIDDNESYSTNEVAINWNAPLAWMAVWASSTAQGN